MDYGRSYEPLMARVAANRNKPGKVVAFVEGQLCFFENDSIIPAVGEEVEVMITRAIYGYYPEGHKLSGMINRGNIRGIMIRVVDKSKDMLVAINGFECAGTMCRTTSSGFENKYQRAYNYKEAEDLKLTKMWLTPGRCDIKYVDNVNAKYGEWKDREPMNVWVNRAKVEELSGCGVRVEGLTRFEDAMWNRFRNGNAAARKKAA